LSGKKFDEGKLKWGLLPWEAVEQIVRVLQHGDQKYGDPDNWKRVTPSSRYFDATMRHLVAWKQGERKDPDSGLPTLAHAATSLLFLLWHDLFGPEKRKK